MTDNALSLVRLGAKKKGARKACTVGKLIICGRMHGNDSFLSPSTSSTSP